MQLAGGEPPNIVTVAFNRVEFKQPVLVGDVVRFLTPLRQDGATSITMQIDVEAERGTEVLHVTEAEVVYVGVDPATAGRSRSCRRSRHAPRAVRIACASR